MLPAPGALKPHQIEVGKTASGGEEEHKCRDLEGQNKRAATTHRGSPKKMCRENPGSWGVGTLKRNNHKVKVGTSRGSAWSMRKGPVGTAGRSSRKNKRGK